MKQLRSLMILQWLPWPSMGGADLRNRQILNTLAELGSVAVVGTLFPNKDYRKPEGLNIAHWSSPFGFKSGVYPMSTQEVMSKAKYLMTDYCYAEENLQEIQRILNTYRPHITLMSQPPTYPFLKMLKQYGRPVIFDCHNVEGVLIRELANPDEKNIKNDEKKMRELLIKNTRMIEAKLCQEADQIWACSARDKELFEQVYKPHTPIFVVPNTIRVEDYQQTENTVAAVVPPVEREKTALFPAAYIYTPNVNTAEFLIKEIYPAASGKIPGFTLLLPGRDPTPFMLEAAKTDTNIRVPGSVPNMLPYFKNAGVLAAPLFEGGGTRLKILEAFAAGLPVVSTSKGAEGIEYTDGKHLLIADSKDAFLQALIRVLTDKPLAERLSANGLALVREKYSWAYSSAMIHKALENLNLTDE